ncbi:hypothetical protein PENSPDRAFT_576884 [Peniophora sp. CONT]|nr:hypothetical protein PENSPDRAFT_576884 [Peniophora sp. CONT]
MTSVLRPALRLARTLPLSTSARTSCSSTPALYVARTSRLPVASASRRTLATHASDRPPSHPTLLVQHPSQDDLDAEEIDAEVVAPDEAKLELTDRAAEQLQTIAKREKSEEAALRIAVESGGCHGYQYKMELAQTSAPDDYIFAHPSIQPARVVVDAVSLRLLKGATVDFATELIGSSFRILDNPQAKGAGCGCGVSWEANV